jgi:hypothetical protein
MASKKHRPTGEMVEDLVKLFKKHNWSGQPIGLSASRVTLKTAALHDLDDTCPDGSSPQWVTYKRPDGTWVTEKRCV